MSLEIKQISRHQATYRDGELDLIIAVESLENEAGETGTLFYLGSAKHAADNRPVSAVIKAHIAEKIRRQHAADGFFAEFSDADF